MAQLWRLKLYKWFLEFTKIAAGPIAGLLLADLFIDIVKINSTGWGKDRCLAGNDRP